MEYFLQAKYLEDKKFKRYLDENSNYIKYLNRNPEYYKNFIKEMKELYKERTSDKLNDAINTIDIVSSILGTLQ
ncbi:MAG: hypothetical protein E7161_00620 [Firmicutes bacterium]|nr:hypothetical protein [Bacillota bacterium]